MNKTLKVITQVVSPFMFLPSNYSNRVFVLSGGIPWYLTVSRCINVDQFRTWGGFFPLQNTKLNDFKEEDVLAKSGLFETHSQYKLYKKI